MSDGGSPGSVFEYLLDAAHEAAQDVELTSSAEDLLHEFLRNAEDHIEDLPPERRRQELEQAVASLQRVADVVVRATYEQRTQRLGREQLFVLLHALSPVPPFCYGGGGSESREGNWGPSAYYPHPEAVTTT